MGGWVVGWVGGGGRGGLNEVLDFTGWEEEEEEEKKKGRTYF